LGVVGKALLFVIAPILAVIEGVKALTGWLGDLFGEEEKVVKSTNQVTTANIANTESSKKRAEAISEVIARLKEEKAANESTVEVASALIDDALIKIENAKKKLSATTSESTRAYLKQYIKETEEYIQTTLVTYGRGAVLSLEMQADIEKRRDALLGRNKPKEDKKEEIKLPEIDNFKLPTLELPVPDTEKFEEHIESKLYQINTIAEAEEFALKLQHASNLIDEKVFAEKVYAIRLQALLEKKRLYDLEPDMARKVQDEITNLERERMLAIAKMEADAAKAKADAAKSSMDAFKKQVNEIQNVVSSYTDLIFKVLLLAMQRKSATINGTNSLIRNFQRTTSSQTQRRNLQRQKRSVIKFSLLVRKNARRCSTQMRRVRIKRRKRMKSIQQSKK
jgi:hypothetical protein